MKDTKFLNKMCLIFKKKHNQLESKQSKSTSYMVSLSFQMTAQVRNMDFYIPLKLQVKSGTTVVRVNEDNIVNTI